MDDYISRAALLERIEAQKCDGRTGTCKDCDTKAFCVYGVVEAFPAADVAPVRHELMQRVKDYAADMEKMYTDVCADFRERTGQDYVCGACKYNDCAYMGADGWCGECPGFESNECFALSDSCKRAIWKIVDILNGAGADEGVWFLNEWPDWDSPAVSHWMPLPAPPEGD